MAKRKNKFVIHFERKGSRRREVPALWMSRFSEAYWEPHTEVQKREFRSEETAIAFLTRVKLGLVPELEGFTAVKIHQTKFNGKKTTLRKVTWLNDRGSEVGGSNDPSDIRTAHQEG